MTRKVWSGSPDGLRHRFTDAEGREVPVRRWSGFGFFFKNSPPVETRAHDEAAERSTSANGPTGVASGTYPGTGGEQP